MASNLSKDDIADITKSLAEALSRVLKSGGGLTKMVSSGKPDTMDEKRKRLQLQKEDYLNKKEEEAQQKHVDAISVHTKYFNNASKGVTGSLLSLDDHIKLSERTFEHFVANASPKDMKSAMEKLSDTFKEFNVKNIYDLQDKLYSLQEDKLKNEKKSNLIDKKISKAKEQLAIFEKHGDDASIQATNAKIKNLENQKNLRNKKDVDLTSKIYKGTSSIGKNATIKDSNTLTESVKRNVLDLVKDFGNADVAVATFVASITNGMLQFKEAVGKQAIEDKGASFFERQWRSITTGVSTATRDDAIRENRASVALVGSVDALNNAFDENLDSLNEITGSYDKSMKMEGDLVSMYQKSGIYLTKNNKLIKQSVDRFKELNHAVGTTPEDFMNLQATMLDDEKIRSDLNSLSDTQRALYMRNIDSQNDALLKQRYSVEQIEKFRKEGANKVLTPYAKVIKDAMKLRALGGAIPEMKSAVEAFTAESMKGGRADPLKLQKLYNDMQVQYASLKTSDKYATNIAFDTLNETMSDLSGKYGETVKGKGTPEMTPNVKLLSENNVWLQMLSNNMEKLTNAMGTPIGTAFSGLLMYGVGKFLFGMLKNIFTKEAIAPVATKVISRLGTGLLASTGAIMTAGVITAGALGYATGTLIYNYAEEWITKWVNRVFGDPSKQNDMGIYQIAISNVSGYIQSFVDYFLKIVPMFDSGMKTVYSSIDSATSYINSVYTTIGGTIATIFDNFNNFWNDVKTQVDKITTIGTNLFTSITVGISSLQDSLTTTFTSIFTKISDWINNLLPSWMSMSPKTQTNAPVTTMPEKSWYSSITDVFSSNSKPTQMGMDVKYDQVKDQTKSIQKTYDSLMDNNKTVTDGQQKNTQVVAEGHKKLNESVNKTTDTIEDLATMLKQYMTITSDMDKQRFEAKYKQDNTAARLALMNKGVATGK